MPQVIIENPILNSPFAEPARHFKFAKTGITNEVEDSRRISSYFMPIPQPKKKGKQLTFDTEWTPDRIEENKFINRVRSRVNLWRQGGYTEITKTSRFLLDYWKNSDRERPLFFCQIEALETAIYITEAAKKCGDAWIENDLRRFNDETNPEIFRLAFKMATGSGKTVVMAMLIAWHALNKFANPQDARFSDTFLIVTPGITIRDRLRVLLPNDPTSYYRERDILPADRQVELRKSTILITNFHAFKPREKYAVARLTKKLLTRNGEGKQLIESPDEMVRRVCRELGNKKNIIVINDEAHHCYRSKPDVDDEEGVLKGDERREAKKREEAARIWITGLEAVKAKIGVRVIYDLSATPFFLRGSGYREGTLFPWVVSDFSLIDAIESGIVKIPRVPVSDDQMKGDQPTYRDLWTRIKDAGLPKKGRGTAEVSGEPKLPKELQGALHSLYGNYEKTYRLWESHRRGTPPVFIVVCNNTNVSKLVYDYVAGWEKTLKNGNAVVQAGNFDIFRNDDGNGVWLSRPNSLLIDSEQLESGEAMNPDFKKIAAREIDEFKAEYRERFPDRDISKLTDEDLLREVMNTVGKPGKLGEHIKCVVSVSMLTEGWDANTVTHILGVRAFGTQLLCEQVIGRGLRRISYTPGDDGLLTPEYAEVYGVPFSFIPCSKSIVIPVPPPAVTRVRALEDRADLEMRFPRVIGYRYDMPSEKLEAKFTADSKMALTTADIPTKVQLDPIVGETSIHTLDDLKRKREQEVVFSLSKRVLEKYFKDDEGNLKHWLFPDILRIARHWLRECLVLKDDAFPQMLLLIEFTHDASDKIHRAIAENVRDDKTLKPILRPYDPAGTTRHVDFNTAKPVYETRPDKSHISHVVADTDTWEQKLAHSLEDMDEVLCYVKNQNLGFSIPYTLGGAEKNYFPDFLVHFNDGQTDPLNLIVEVTGEKKKDKAAKVATAQTLWVPAVNNHGGFGRWAFIEISDPWDAKNLIRSSILNKLESQPA